MATAHSKTKRSDQPEFMLELGLAPPYTEEDVKQAYLTRAKKLHPDHGGTANEFHTLQMAFEKAKEYAEFRSDRRQWIAANMQSYIVVRNAVERLEKLGAKVETNAVEWLEKSFGDFAQLTESVTRVRLEDSPQGNAVVRAMLADQSAFRSLERLELPGCQISDESVLELAPFEQLAAIDLSRTTVTAKAAQIVDRLPNLRSLNLSKTKCGWWTRRKVRSQLARRAAAATAAIFR